MKYLAQPTFSHSIEIKKSDFITNVFHVNTAAEAEAIIADMKKKFPDATHHCSAYLIHNETLIKKAYDDGEPSKTAGLPILRSIEYSEFENILVIVTRYFGGIKLGAGGLVRAYSQASREALSLAPAYTPALFYPITISGDIQFYGNLSHYLYSHFTLEAPQTVYESDQFILTCSIAEALFPQFESLIKNQFHYLQFSVQNPVYI